MENINVEAVMHDNKVTFPDHTVRLLVEYKELVERTEKLEALLMKHEEGKLGVVLNCPQFILEHQFHSMRAYGEILRKRMLVYEGITLDELNAFMRG